MGSAKKLNLPFEKLVDIAKALNENIIANKSRSKGEKVPTDKYIKITFNINRKDYIETIKDMGIKYNKSNFLYDIPSVTSGHTKETLLENKEVHKVLLSNTKETLDESHQSNTQEIQEDKKESNTVVTLQKEHQSHTKVILSQEVKEVVKTTLKMEYPKIDEMIRWFRMQKINENIIEIPEIDLNNAKLKGEVVSRSIKTYKEVIDEFVEFCKTRRETQKDLIALALIEFVNKYKR